MISRLFRYIKGLAVAAALTAGGVAHAQQPNAAALRTDFPDPFVLPLGNGYYAYATNIVEGRVNVPVAFSTDLSTWQLAADESHRTGYRDALPNLPRWVEPGSTWAPEVMRIGNQFVLYYTARHRARGQQCIGVATAAHPRGPFVPQGDAPMLCQHDLGGTIDASPFRDADGQMYLYYKNDGNHPSARTTTELWGQRMSADGLSLVGDPVSLARNDLDWEAHVVEAPFMVRRGTSYILFYSANDFAWQERQPLSLYATGYATCTGPLGPCTDAPGAPFLASRRQPDCLSGPGHAMVFRVGEQDYIAFHSWVQRRGCGRGGNARSMHISKLDWNGDTPVLGDNVVRAER